MPKTIHPTPPSLNPNGALLPKGAYADIIPDASTAKWDAQGGLVKRRRSQRKAWIFLGAYTKDLMVGMAVADAGYLANAFAYFYVPSEGIYEEEKVLLPFGFDNDFDPNLKDEWKLRNFTIKTEGGKLKAICNGKFHLEISMEHNDRGLSFMCPSEERPFNFTYKNLCLPTEAKVIHKDRVYLLDGKVGGVDFSKGYPPRKTRWNWALVSGSTTEGVPVGLNLFFGHNGKYENAAWLGDRRFLLSNTHFHFNKGEPLDKQEWKMVTEDGDVEVRFIPSGARSEKINAGLLSHDFTQPFGRFEGVLRIDGKEHAFTGYGPVEDHTSLW